MPKIEPLSKRLPPHYERRYQRLLAINAQAAQEFWDKWAYEAKPPRTKRDAERERIVKLVEGNKLVRRV